MIKEAMPAVVESHPAQLPPGVRRRLTRADCAALEAAGLLESERFELIDGELIPKVPKSPLHSFALLLLIEWLREVFGSRHVLQEVPIELGEHLSRTNEPEPDAIVLRRSAASFRNTSPGPSDLLLVAEISATSQSYDLGAKAALYASGGIPEYWVLDLRDMRMIVHRNPDGEKYSSIVAYAVDEAVSPLAAQASSIRLQDLMQ
ncbi:MAG: Uma2 family endonuclease [Acidobacteria bacterium]|nr:Uma2 family endonuclease [Acidobacteriota bacterium]